MKRNKLLDRNIHVFLYICICLGFILCLADSKEKFLSLGKAVAFL